MNYERATTAFTVSAAVLILAGGYVHLHEWLQTYRAIPASVPGAAVVRVGFPLNAATSVAVAGALVAAVLRFTRHLVIVLVAAIAFQAASLITLVQSRTGSVFGWTEPVWTRAANQTRVVEIAALIAMAAAIVIIELQDRAERRQLATLAVGAR